MRIAYLLRHAKSSRDDPRLDDHERPLAPRGERAAAAIGAYLAQRFGEPSPPAPAGSLLVLCSTARRAVETLEHARPHLPGEIRVVSDHELYLASASRLLGRLREIDAKEPAVLLIAHNPGIAELAVSLARGDEPDARRMQRGYPTAGLAEIAFDTAGWSEIAPGAGALRRFVTPKELV